MNFTIKKLEKQLDDIKKMINCKTMDITKFKYIEEDVKGAEKPSFDDSKWDDFKIGEYWGGYDVIAWFRTTMEIPEEFKGQKLALRFLVGPRAGGHSTAETLLYVNGKALQGIDIWHEEAWLSPELYENGQIQLSLRAWSGVLGVPDQRQFKEAQLVWIDEAAEEYYYLLDTTVKAVKEMNENDLRRTRILEIANKSYNMVNMIKPYSDGYYLSIGKALEFLQDEINELQQLKEIKPKIVGIGHSHIDMAWLWRLQHTREKAQRTFATVLNLMRQYPDYKYMHSSPQLYKYLKDDAPEIFAEVKDRIKAGDWEITGGMWVEPDTNVPNGESLIRQLQFGKRYMKEEFGVDSKVVWLPDVFGYSWALPQIMKKSGIEYFMTTKISWSQYNRFPYDTFNWRGIDGTEILTHFITTPEEGSWHYTYNGPFQPDDIKGLWDNYRQKDINDELLLAFGWGDGGGGPTKEMLEVGKTMKNLPGMPEVELGRVEPYFKRLDQRIKDKDVPLWDGELYLEFHRGTYTSQAWLKRANRKSEVLYHNAEWLNSLGYNFDLLEEYPHQKLNQGWELLLLNQFHDILPGSSIRQVYEDSREDFKQIMDIGNEAFKAASSTIIENLKVEEKSITAFNSVSDQRNEIVELPYDQDMNPIQVVKEGNAKKALYKLDNIPSLGYKNFKLSDLEAVKIENKLIVKEDYLENQYYQLKLNKDGQLISIYDKGNDREVLAKNKKGNIFQAFEDRPMNFDAWDIDIYYQEKMEEVEQLQEAVVEEQGPLRGVLRLVWKFYDSIITQRITIYHDSPRIDFRTVVDWEEKQTLLKVAFPVSVRSTTANYDIQFGNIERPTHWNTSWDFARFEVPGQKWVDLSEGNYGVSLLNDCKYGFDVKDNLMRITLIKSAVRPDETADRERHYFTNSLLAHEGSWQDSNVNNQAYALNYPIQTIYNNAVKIDSSNLKEDQSLSDEYEFATLDANNVRIETIKKAEDEDCLIVRLYEYKKYRLQEVKLTFAEEIKKAVECNLVEEGNQKVIYSDNKLRFSIKPYEIKTFKVWF